MLRLAVITDIHYGRRVKNKYGDKAPALVEKFVKAANKFKADTVIDMGDRVSCQNIKADKADMTSLRKKFNDLNAPVHYVLGNHDVKFLSIQDNEKIMKSPADSHSLDVNGFHLVFWNPNVDNHPVNGGLYLNKGDLKWLKDDLAKTDAPTILFTHIPLDDRLEDALKSPEHNGIARRFSYPEGTEIRKTIKEAGNVILCMAGHRHANFSKTIDGTHYVTVQSLVQAPNKKNARAPYGTYAFVEIDTSSNDNKNEIKIELKGKYKKTYELPFSKKLSPSP
jgi:predicted phosphodiesterase